MVQKQKGKSICDKTSRGGPRNYKKPHTDSSHLLDKLKDLAEQNGKEAFALFEYENLVGNARPRMQSLAKMAPLLIALASVQPSMTIIYSDLKNSLCDVFANPRTQDSKPTGLSVQQAAMTLADKLIIAQRHVRDLTQSDIDAYSMAGYLKHQLKNVIAMIQPVDSTPTQAKTSSSSSQTKKRHLAKHVSDTSVVSCDSDGLPRLSPLKTAMQAKSEDGGGCDDEDDEEVNLLRQPSKILPTKKEIKLAKKPATAEDGKLAKEMDDRPTKKDNKLTKGGKKAGKKYLEDFEIDKEQLKICGPFEKQSYLVMKQPKEKKQPLVVGCSSTQTSNFHAVITKVYNYCKNKQGKVMKSMAVKKRDDLISL